MKNKVYKFLTAVFFILFFGFALFPVTNVYKIKNDNNKKTIIILQGHFTGDIEGDIGKLVLFDDYTFSATLATAKVHAVISGSYTLDGKNFSFDGHGEALGPEQNIDFSTSNFSVFAKGELDLEKASGSGSLFFVFENWDEKDKCDYTLSLYINPDD